MYVLVYVKHGNLLQWKNIDLVSCRHEDKREDDMIGIFCELFWLSKEFVLFWIGLYSISYIQN